MVVLLLEGFSTTLAGVWVVLTVVLLGQPWGFTAPVEVGGGVDPVEVGADPEFVPHAASTKISVVTSEISNQVDRCLAIWTVRIIVTPCTLRLTAYYFKRIL